MVKNKKRNALVTHFNRRFMIKALAGTSALALAPLRWAASAALTRPMPPSKEEATFLIHSERPWALETMRSSFGFSPITPESHFFVRNNLPMPDASIIENRDAWRFEVEGTERSGSLSLLDLQRMNTSTVATVLQCSGNGRAFFPHKPSGSQWGIGAAGCALWTGVSVADVLELFGGAKDGLKFLTTTGGETIPEGIDFDQVAVQRSVLLDKGLKDCMLVWEMNGAPISLAHGGPLRLIVPGYYGVNNVKWVKKIAATAEESGAEIQQTGYRVRDIGQSGGPQHPSMWRMDVKSWINGPGADDKPVLPGRHYIYGVAFSGERGIEKVEVSADHGRSWEPAELVGPDLGPNAWRTFKHQVDLSLGKTRYVSRATDLAGDSQPQKRKENHRGYGNTSWEDAGLEINVVSELPKFVPAPKKITAASSAVVAAVAKTSTKLSAKAMQGKDIYLTKAQPNCGVCHTLADAGSQGAVGPNLDVLKPTEAQVSQAISQGVGIMPSFGAQLSSDEIAALAAYVAETTR
jgi:DMSO/TMAO reductase YedYZ molybdopterin-dependent catalytic subunit/mono/diheme cytochrome c family protein